jgi:hypothetical protein
LATSWSMIAALLRAATPLAAVVLPEPGAPGTWIRAGLNSIGSRCGIVSAVVPDNRTGSAHNMVRVLIL